MQFKPFASPRRFVFRDPDTNRDFIDTTKEGLIRQIVAYRSANELEPIEHLGIVLDNYLAGLPENAGSVELGPELHRGLLLYMKGGISLLKNLWYGDANKVTQAEADARAAQCVGCKYNQFPDKGMFVAWSDMIAEASVGDSKSKYHNDLGSCMVCTCTLKAKVFYKGNMGLSASQKEQMQPVNCWQLHS